MMEHIECGIDETVSRVEALGIMDEILKLRPLGNDRVRISFSKTRSSDGHKGDMQYLPWISSDKRGSSLQEDNAGARIGHGLPEELPDRGWICEGEQAASEEKVP